METKTGGDDAGRPMTSQCFVLYQTQQHDTICTGPIVVVVVVVVSLAYRFWTSQWTEWDQERLNLT